MICARIENGKVVNIEIWDECPKECKEVPEGFSGWDYEDGEFILPVVEPEEE